jgi:dipeptidyl aminopeptidase/acylaminoacyl peptidase
LVQGEKASFASPSWSPDGATLAVTGNWRAGAVGPYNEHLWVVQAGGGDSRCLSEGFERSLGDSTGGDTFVGSDARPVWTPGGSEILVVASDSGATHIHAFNADGNGSRQITTGPRRHYAFSLSRDGKKIAYLAQTATSPGDLYVRNLDGGSERQLTTLNADFLGGVSFSQPQEFSADSLSDGSTIQGWVLTPPGFDPARKYPMILQIHGGPHTMYGHGFMHEFHLMAARGYVVVYCNPRGSSGYDEEFMRYTNQRWGETDMPDVMAAVEWALDQSYVDPNRLGVTGGSYGGYLTNWIIGHTDRFRAAVTQRCVSNLHSFYGTSDIGWFFGDMQFGGTAWEQRERYMKYSPISYVANMTTPLLIIHSENDYRTPIEQGEQMFISLKRLGREVEFARFPDSNHDLSRNGKPSLRIERLERIIGWFDRHL